MMIKIDIEIIIIATYFKVSLIGGMANFNHFCNLIELIIIFNYFNFHFQINIFNYCYLYSNLILTSNFHFVIIIGYLKICAFIVSLKTMNHFISEITINFNY